MEKISYSDYFVVSEREYQKDGNYRFVYSTRSGLLAIIPTQQYHYVEHRLIPPQNSDVYAVLQKAEILVQTGEDECQTVLQENQKAVNNNKNLNFVLIPTSFCNMGCSYCGQVHTKGGLDKDKAEKVLARVTNAMQNKSPKTMHIAWFGGEPMVGYFNILKISQQLISLADKLGIKYHSNITTNGSLLTLDKILVLHQKAKVEEICITFDGPPQLHDARRILKNGKKSFEQVTKTIQRALREPDLAHLRYSFRTNIDKKNAPYVDEYLELMHQLGFAHKNIFYELMFVHSWSNDVSAVELEKHKFAELEVGWMMKMLELNMNFGYLPRRKKTVCITVSPNAEVISSSGKIFSCTEHPLVPQHEEKDYVANLGQGHDVERSPGKFDRFNDEDIHQLPCKTCKFIAVCGGACPKEWLEGNRPCPSFKYNIQQRLDLYAVNHGYRLVM